MNNKQAKKLRRIARQKMIETSRPSKIIYRDLKTMYKNGTIKLK